MRYRHLVRGALEAQWAAVEPELRATVEAGVETLATCALVRRATDARFESYGSVWVAKVANELLATQC